MGKSRDETKTWSLLKRDNEIKRIHTEDEKVLYFAG